MSLINTINQLQTIFIEQLTKAAQRSSIVLLELLVLISRHVLIPHFFRGSFRIFSNFTMLAPRTGLDARGASSIYMLNHQNLLDYFTMLDHQNLLDLTLSHKLPQSVVFVVLVVLVLIFSHVLLVQIFGAQLQNLLGPTCISPCLRHHK